MSRTRAALLGGPVFFVSWFVGAQVLWFASGGVVNDESAPNAAEYPEAEPETDETPAKQGLCEWS